MERKVQEVKGSFLVTVPKSLAQRHGLQKGSTVEFREAPEGIMMQSTTQESGHIVYTIGYAGRELEGFLDKLEQNGIEQVADVRELPLSRKEGFSKTPMSEALAERGIDYRHLKPLGAPKEMRDAYKEGESFDWFSDAYEEHLSNQQMPYEALVGASFRKRTALLCVEEKAEECHRSVLAHHLQSDGFAVNHL